MERARIRSFSVGEDGLWVPHGNLAFNTRLNESVAIISKLLLTGDPKYQLSGMYLEFANAAPPVTTPGYGSGADHGRPYYNSLAGHPTRDYLRVPLVSKAVLAPTNVNYPEGHELTFYAMTSGSVGVHGKPFSSGSNSTIIGGAIVAMVDLNDPTKDKVFSRFYFAGAEQPSKPASAQVGVEWIIPLP